MNFAEKIVDVTQEIFETMIMVDVTAGEPLSEHKSRFQCSLSAMVGFAGFKQGNLTLHAPDAVARGLTQDFLGMEVESINEDVEDAMGELANMLAGSLKPFISSENGKVELSLPSVVHGEEYTLTVVNKADWVIVPFTVSHGDFLVGLEIKKQ
ncbi:chemotaxis protein CheX [Desulfosalsimonas propionicica]|uniref:Chemotaxis protein CheX n=1 Tax=Desulfosalsimonas propionicica TaxID=332175 RepID=A0A7W0CBM1_9BACT|nr:chemotaxis protein CheX [Desulfosalsimonas propionicica]MBA2882672.1 chemotaxis protein CheX [Desulfosalsimonas propionicica]